MASYGQAYRPHIEGLRAVAVAAVVAYHAGLGLNGGFVGVDVFFVISGFLITQQIASEISRGTFTLSHFFARRAMRILPALFATLGLSAVAALVLFMPQELVLFGRSMLMAVLSVSNFGFWLEQGYFDVSAQVKPLLHTWSLGIEWQFYLLLPLILLALGKSRTSWFRPLIFALCIFSIAVGVWLAPTSPAASFFLLPSRFWELGAGGLLALSPALGPRLAWQGSMAATCGLGLICFACFASDGAQAFPATTAFAAVAGAAFVIAGGRVGNAVSAALAVPPLRFVGRISYSLYLVHWPLIVFFQYRTGHMLTLPEAAFVIAASLLLAWVMWKYVEQPFRHRSVGRVERFRVPATAGGAMALAITGAVSLASGGWPGRLPTEVQRIYAAKADRTPYEVCIREAKSAYTSTRPLQPQDICKLNLDGGAKPPRFMVWGDSHAAALAPGIAQAASRAGESGYLAAHGGCPPLLDYDTPNPSVTRRSSCRAFNTAVMDLITHEKVQLVFLVGRWPREILGVENGREGLFYDPRAKVDVTDRSAIVATALDETLAQLRTIGATAVLVMDVPEPGYDVPATMARAALYGRSIEVDPPRGRVDERQRLERRVLVTAAARHNALIVDPTAAFCDETDCEAERDGVPLYADADHLTKSEAENLSPMFAKAFRRLEMMKPHMANAPLPRGQDFW